MRDNASRCTSPCYDYHDASRIISLCLGRIGGHNYDNALSSIFLSSSFDSTQSSQSPLPVTLLQPSGLSYQSFWKVCLPSFCNMYIPCGITIIFLPNSNITYEMRYIYRSFNRANSSKAQRYVQQHHLINTAISMLQPDLQIPPQICLSHSIVAGGTFNQHNQINTVRNGERGYARLVENVAPAALHDSGHVVDPPKCHPNTRVAIIDSIIDWTSGANVDLRDKPIVWMKGGAGAGKSAIARSVAERCSELGLLLGTFFFGAADTTRNHVGRLVATLAYQMCIVLPELRDRVSKLVEDDPLIFSRSITTQLTILVVRPLSEALADHSGPTETPRLIIIDGLDECSASIDSQRDLLVALQEATSTTTLIRFLVCSRPENHLNSAFGLPCMVKILHKIFLDNDCSAAQDIRRFFEDKFHAIKEGHIFKHMLPATWPMPEVVRTLVYKSSGQFIYAATVVRYVESPKHRPHQRLDAVFNLRPAFKDLPFTELDSLYRHIISKAEELPTVLDILAFPALYGSFPALEMEVMLQLEKGDVEIMLADILSVVTVHKDTRVKFLHKSLIDFLSDSQRAGDLYRDLSAVRLQHVARSISIFSNGASGSI
ncbi:hypothetical protein D9613_004414 [Agrocybe pediades]|uniref:Nephrocystin 3-like N-terminal domain-containing protein n=1 Tax=Agrocybe pediades TaxID=84607 RepID=A0A8H4QJW0_9AGAR|nr:hypothetical protein D9613_004414 [Agrocybe pediades]